jgi:hypothetical protein
MAESENLTEQLNVMVTPTTKVALEERAWLQRTSVAALVRRALNAYVEGTAAVQPAPPASDAQHKFGSER